MSREKNESKQEIVIKKKNFFQEMAKGSIIGCISATTMFPIDKVTFVYQTLKGEAELSMWSALKKAFAWPNTFNGYFPGLVSTLAKNAVVFSVKGEIENHIDKTYSGFVAGLTGVYLTSPCAVVKALAYNNQPFCQSIYTLKYKDYFRGVHTKAFCDGVYFGTYLILLVKVKMAMDESPLANKACNNSATVGSISGFIGGFFSNPLAVITMGQRVNGTTLVEEAQSLYNDGGLKRFYRGFFKTNAVRMAAQGAVVATAIELAESISSRTKLGNGNNE